MVEHSPKIPTSQEKATTAPQLNPKHGVEVEVVYWLLKSPSGCSTAGVGVVN